MVEIREVMANFLPRNKNPRINKDTLTTAVMVEIGSGIQDRTTRAMPVDPPSINPLGTTKAHTAKASSKFPPSM